MAHDRRYVYLLNAAQKSLSRYIERHISNRAGISATQAGALFVLNGQDGALSGEVALALDIAPSAMTGLADRMVKSGLIERRVDEHDKRSYRLWLTEAGRTAILQASGELAPLNEKLTQAFSDEEMEVVSRWLAAVRDRSQ
ncbi:MarR family winged helix-turn-helix transcriptional regulator [Pseudomonas capsici]|uniref:MarR family winged helix-turn-helix transcriptional regulator n=1 Tax=Pseudomonas capsici TaxID=2810614 RepID=UPI0021F14942|nr:MarR family winged helix-turn-helix transcriptional regulator [Pseudomonas capsici]MCV4340571.1 MarR family winged helix-turn-helix transcriptional regulator [Pseudomonas capsici]